MTQFYVKISTIKDVRDFIAAVSAAENDMELTSGRYIVDAKSIMGIFSLDLLQPILLTIHGEVGEDLLNTLSAFKVDVPEQK